MKPIRFLGDSLKRLRDFSAPVRQDAGYQLDRIQRGLRPFDSKPIQSVGRGVEELSIWDESGTYRIFFIARLCDAIYVLHSFSKKTQETPKRDIELAKIRFSELMRGEMS